MSAGPRRSDVTELIEGARGGDRAAADQVFASLYAGLKRLARSQLHGADVPMHDRPGPRGLFQAGAGRQLAVNDRQPRYARASRVMRPIVLNSVRARSAQRRGGGMHIDALDTQALRVSASEGIGEDVLALDEALRKLAALEPDLERLVELRLPAAMGLVEISALGGRSERSLKRDWRRARAFLHAELGGANRESEAIG